MVSVSWSLPGEVFLREGVGAGVWDERVFCQVGLSPDGVMERFD